MKIDRLLTIIISFLLSASYSVLPICAAEKSSALAGLLDYYSGKRDLTDWEAIALGLNGVKIKTPWFAKSYFTKLEDGVKEKNGEFRLATDYARLAFVYKSHGKNPANIAGYDFIEKLKRFENLQNQGINAYTWTLIALRGQDDDVTRPLIENLLAYQTTGGGFSFTRNPGAGAGTDADLTAMAVTALAPYSAEAAVKSAVDDAIKYLRNEPKVYDYSESVSQAIIALCSAGIEPDAALLTALEGFRTADGFYAHAPGGDADAIATAQAALALTAVYRYENGLGGIYE